MLNDYNSFNKDGRNLVDVFKELQAMQNQPKSTILETQEVEKPKKSKVSPHFNFSHKNKKTLNSFKEQLRYNPNATESFNRPSSRNVKPTKNSELKLSHIIIGCSMLIIGMAVLFPKGSPIKESYAKEETSSSVINYEINKHSLNMQSIISENAGMDRVKEQVTEERDVNFKTNYTNNASLPKGEEVVKQEGAIGKDKVTVVKTYENGEFVEEIILSKETLTEPTPKIIDLGTSEFLAKNQVHIGDTMYLVNDGTLRETADDASEEVADIKSSLDVKLLELTSEDWCKVSFDGVEGYIKTSNLTSAAVTPSIVEKNRIQRILLKVNIDMELNKVSDLTLNDYKKIFTNLPNDTKGIFEANYQNFYNAEKKYKVNGIFLAAMAAHESAWGTSQIAEDKHNLFGYGSYDETPYESSYDFTDYSEGIETVAKTMAKYYLNPAGTKIYDDETALAWYFNGPTLQGVNTRYASDKDWYKKVYSYMQLLYNSLQ